MGTSDVGPGNSFSDSEANEVLPSLLPAGTKYPKPPVCTNTGHDNLEILAYREKEETYYCCIILLHDSNDMICIATTLKPCYGG